MFIIGTKLILMSRLVYKSFQTAGSRLRVNPRFIKGVVGPILCESVLLKTVLNTAQFSLAIKLNYPE